ncbi:hypothetical protein BDZ91DRAFT_740100 [Kalaharituber pfeilii]|nr:hypothetical protein BDZ91DRAFT_740100 [Kalaharituber pfeilii]
MSEGIDAWYATIPRVEDNSNFKFEVKRGRPPLICQQDDKWSYGSWTGTMKNLLSNETDGPPFSLRLGIRRILQSEFAFPMIVNIGQSLNAGALKSATRLLQGDNALDANAAKAEFDMLRLVLAAFIATRDVFRDAAMAGPALGKENRGNALDAPDGTKIEGTADFVMVSSVVSTLRFGYLLAIPLTLILLLLLSSLFNATRRVKALKTNGGRLGRFVKFVIDLQAAQLYRKVDEILAGMKFPDGEKDPTLELPEWKNKTSSLPYVRPRSATSRPSMERLVHPQMQEANTALLKMVDPNSDPKATDKHPEPYLAVGHAPQPEGEFQDGGSECKQGKDNSEESSIEGTGEDEAGNHGEAIIPWTVLE